MHSNSQKKTKQTILTDCHERFQPEPSPQWWFDFQYPQPEYIEVEWRDRTVM